MFLSLSLISDIHNIKQHKPEQHLQSKGKQRWQKAKKLQYHLKYGGLHGTKQIPQRLHHLLVERSRGLFTLMIL